MLITGRGLKSYVLDKNLTEPIKMCSSVVLCAAHCKMPYVLLWSSSQNVNHLQKKYSPYSLLII